MLMSSGILSRCCRYVASAILLAVAAVVFSASAGCAAQNQRTVLRVIPYPDIPGDFDTMLAIVEAGFEAQHPDIDLELVRADVSDVYDLGYLAKVLTADTGRDGVHIVESDTIMMGDLALAGILRPQTFSMADWHPLIVQATTVNGVRYGVPHWLCGNFLITRDAQLAGSQGVEDMYRRIREIKPQGPWLAGNYAGNSYLVLYYTQAWGENRPGTYDLQPAITGPIDNGAVGTLSVATALCGENGANPCVDGTYYNDFSPIFERTVRGEYAALQGFSESMWYMAQYGAIPEQWYVAPLPVGKVNRNVLLGDAYIARKDMDAATATAAEKFYAFMMQDATYRDIIFSGGSRGGVPVPRYLAPARLGIFDLPELRADTYYRRIFAAMTTPGGTNYPNLYVPENRDRIYEQVMPYLNGTMPASPRRGIMQHEGVLRQIRQ